MQSHALRKINITNNNKKKRFIYKIYTSCKFQKFKNLKYKNRYVSTYK